MTEKKFSRSGRPVGSWWENRSLQFVANRQADLMDQEGHDVTAGVLRECATALTPLTDAEAIRIFNIMGRESIKGYSITVSSEFAKKLECERAALIEVVWAYLQTASSPKGASKLAEIDAHARTLLDHIKNNWQLDNTTSKVNKEPQ